MEKARVQSSIIKSKSLKIDQEEVDSSRTHLVHGRDSTVKPPMLYNIHSIQEVPFGEDQTDEGSPTKGRLSRSDFDKIQLANNFKSIANHLHRNEEESEPQHSDDENGGTRKTDLK